MKKLIFFVKHFVFADDTALVISHKDVKVGIELIQAFFNNLCRWSHDTGLLINAKKQSNAYKIQNK